MPPGGSDRSTDLGHQAAAGSPATLKSRPPTGKHVRDVAWMAMAAATCVMLIALVAPWERVHLEQETDGPIMERTWHFAPWGTVVDGETHFFDHEPYGMDGRNRTTLLAGAAALIMAVALIMVRPLQDQFRWLYLGPAFLAIVAASTWYSKPLRFVCFEAARAGHKQRCDADEYSTSAFLVLAAVAYAAAAFLPRPEPPGGVLPELPEPVE